MKKIGLLLTFVLSILGAALGQDKPLPPPTPPVEYSTYDVEKPRFPGCENETDKDARKQCAEDKLLDFIYKNLNYPPLALEGGVEGTVVISFYVDKDGVIKTPVVMKDIGAGCGKEAKRIVDLMNEMPEKWIAGNHKGNSVEVYFNLPVAFSIHLIEALKKPKKVCKLNLKDKGMEQLPNVIGQLVNLKRLDLRNNQLKKLPRTMERLQKLKVLKLSGNQFESTEVEKIKKLLPDCKVIVE